MKKKLMKNKIKLIIMIIIIIFLIILSLYIIDKNKINPVDKNNKNTITYKITSQSDPLSIAQDLEKKKIINSSKKLYKMFLENEGVLYVNNYSLSPSMSLVEIYEIITDPVSNLVSKDNLLIYEGELLTDVATKLSSKINKTKEEILNYWSDEDNLKFYIEKYDILTSEILNKKIKYPLEGYLYPATYPLDENDTLETITLKILDQAEEQYKPYLKEKNKLNLSLHESLVLASIVERETMTDTDKYKVAGVFYNRIKQNMPLQSDITVLYAKGEHKEIVTYEDLEYNSPYNTYKNTGIPPSAIATVSQKSLDAVYNPEENEYLYFFAKQDTGEVVYSKTYEEHQKISEKYAWE